MYGCVFGSTSGFTRSETGARLPSEPATALRRSSSGTDSTLKHLTPASSARRISSALLATPENTTCSALPPAASTRASSPPETMSKPAPSRANTFSTPRLLFAFTATWSDARRPSQALA